HLKKSLRLLYALLFQVMITPSNTLFPSISPLLFLYCKVVLKPDLTLSTKIPMKSVLIELRMRLQRKRSKNPILPNIMASVNESAQHSKATIFHNLPPSYKKE